MVQYLLYKRRNNSTPFMILNPDTIDSSSTSMFFIGKQTTSYGQPQEQSLLWMLENFANTTPPTPAILGQSWFNNVAGINQLYVCINESLQTWQRVGSPATGPTPPSSYVNTGDLWFNTNTNQLFAYNGTIWVLVGPANSVPTTATEQIFFSGLTSDATPTELFVNGVANARLVMSNGPSYGQSWMFDVKLIGRCAETASENVCMKFSGIIDKSNTGTISIPGGIQQEIYNISSGLTTASGSVYADSVNNSLGISVTGQVGKTIQWTAIASIVLLSN